MIRSTQISKHVALSLTLLLSSKSILGSTTKNSSEIKVEKSFFYQHEQEHLKFYKNLVYLTPVFGLAAGLANTKADSKIQSYYQNNIKSQKTDDLAFYSKKFLIYHV